MYAQDVSYVVQFHWLRLFEMCNLYGVLSLASTANDVILRHCTCFRPFHDLPGPLVKENQYVQGLHVLSFHSFRSFYMVNGGKSRRRAQVTGRFERQIFSGLSYSRKYRIDLCSHIKPIAYLIVGCMALGYVSPQTI